MSLVAVGLSHHTSPLELRERLAFPAETIPAGLLALKKRCEGAGVVLLSTCNRVEIYMSHPEAPEVLHGEIRAFLAEWHGIPESEFGQALYAYSGRETVGHLFRVTSSLDSLVVGEVQILGQIHDAYLQSQAEQCTDKIIHSLFQKAFVVAKHVRTKTSIGVGKVSISSVAVGLAVSIFKELAGKTVMVVGSGEMAELTLKSLIENGARGVLVANRNPERAQKLAQNYAGEAFPFEELRDHLSRADIVISTTAAPRTILHAPDFQHALKHRAQEPMLAIDIAVPRDIDADAAELDNLYLYNVDDLEQVVNENLEARQKEVETATVWVDDGVDRFMQWMAGLAAEPTITSMAEEFDQIRDRELIKTLATLPDLSDKQRQEIERLTQRIVRTILQRPMTNIKREINHHDPNTVLHLVKRLFGIEEPSG